MTGETPTSEDNLVVQRNTLGPVKNDDSPKALWDLFGHIKYLVNSLWAFSFYFSRDWRQAVIRQKQEEARGVSIDTELKLERLKQARAETQEVMRSLASQQGIEVDESTPLDEAATKRAKEMLDSRHDDVQPVIRRLQEQKHEFETVYGGAVEIQLPDPDTWAQFRERVLDLPLGQFGIQQHLVIALRIDNIETLRQLSEKFAVIEPDLKPVYRKFFRDLLSRFGL